MSQQSQRSVEAHIEALKLDQQLIRKNVQSLAVRLGISQTEILNCDEELRDAEQTLGAVNAAIGTVREQLIQAAANLATTERSVERVTQTVHELTALQEEVDAWRKEALETQQAGPGGSDLDRRLGAFTKALRKYLLALGHSAVRSVNVEGVRLDEDSYLIWRRGGFGRWALRVTSHAWWQRTASRSRLPLVRSMGCIPELSCSMNLCNRTLMNRIGICSRSS